MWLLLASALLGCDGEEPAAAPPRPLPDLPQRAGGGVTAAPPPPPARERRGGGACALDAPRLVAAHVRARRGLVVADGWRFALDDALIAIGPDGARHEVPVAEPRRLLAAGLVEGRPLALYDASTRDAAHALIARDPIGGAELVRPLPGPISTMRRAASDEALWLAWSGPHGMHGLERFAREAQRLATTSLDLGNEQGSDEVPVEILGLAVEAERWAAIWRLGPTEAPDARVFVSTPEGHRESDGLHEVLAVESCGFDGDALVVVASFEFARPGVVRFTPDEQPLAILAPDEEAPPPLADRRRALLHMEEESLWLTRSDALGQRLGERLRVVDGPVEMAALDRRDDGSLVLDWTTEDGLYERTVRCPAP